MHNPRRTHHGRLQRRVAIGTIVVALVAALIAIPLIINDDLRYDLAMRTDQIPGQSVEKIADGDDGVLLVVLPLDHAEDDQVNPWLFRAQFLAWPNGEGRDLENLESGKRAVLPLEAIDFVSANGDGSLVLFRGEDTATGGTIALTVDPATMNVEQLGSPDSLPDEPGDWETSVWDKQVSWCHRGSPNKRFVACFVPAELSSYAAGDWELSVQFWGNYESQHPLFRGRGLLPFVGFAEQDSVLYFQNERGIWRANVPADVLERAPKGVPFGTPEP